MGEPPVDIAVGSEWAAVKRAGPGSNSLSARRRVRRVAGERIYCENLGADGKWRRDSAWWHIDVFLWNHIVANPTTGGDGV